MMPQIYQDIEAAVASGIPPQYIAAALMRKGWPTALVNEALNAWLTSHGRLQHKTEFKQWLKKYKARALPATMAVVGISVISSSIILLRPWPTKIMVDSAFGNIQAPGSLAHYTHTPTLILITSLMTVGIFVAGALFGILRDYFVLKLGFWLNRNIKEESFRHILHLPLYHQERLAKGDYIYRQNILTNSLSDLVLDTTSSIAQSIIMIIGILSIMVWFNAKLTLISIVLIPFLFVLIRVFGPKLSRISRALTQVASNMSSTITESIDNAETVQSYNLEEKQVAKARGLWWQNYYLTRGGLLWGHAYRFSNSLLIILSTSAVMYLGGTAALHGQMTLGQLLIYMTYMGYLLGPVENLATEIASRNQKIIDVSRVYEVLTDHEGVESLRRGNHLPLTHGAVEFQNVSYSYNNVTVLQNINLSIKSGQKVGIIGPSGSGKTTLLKLLPLFIEPSQGRIMIDNVDIQTVSLNELRHAVAWISQSPQLFSGAIVENLHDGDIYRQITLPEIQMAITVANVKEFTDRLPLGLNSPAGESGNSLSGGQKQRIAIARGLIKNAPIICMDEPTAALDDKSENYIRDSIAKLIKGKTVLLVTHRKALLGMMDVVYVMENGRLRQVSEFGGLDAYLAKINSDGGALQNIAAEREQTHAQAAEHQVREQQRAAELEEENALLQKKLNLASDQSRSDRGTIFIDH